MRRTITELQIRQHDRAHELIDNQPHMTLSPDKDGKPWLEGKHRMSPDQKPSLLTASEAFSQGFHAGARWGLRVRASRAARPQGTE